MKTAITYTLLGLAALGGSYWLMQDSADENTTSTQTTKAEPLYWVAPMDPNYRRDKPGKSPMGMDLVPVYADQDQTNSGRGVIKIAPNVINNLGVRTALVSRESMQMPIDTVGYVRYNEDSLIHIHPRVEGWVDTLFVKTTGQTVKQGEPLYALYSPQLVNAQEEFLLARSRNNQGLINAAYERLNALQMPKSSIDLLARSGKVQQTVIFSAPQSGVVDNLNIREGFYVKPGTTMLSIGALDEVWVEAEIFERQAALVKAGQQASMRLGFLPGEQWQGELDYIYPTLDPQTRTLRVRLRFANPERKLKPNMFAQLTIYSDVAEDTLVVPREAVIRTGSQDRVVMALADGEFKSVAVQLGLVGKHQAQILSGLQAGDRVVRSAQFLLDSESSVDSDFMRMSALDDAATDSHEHSQTSDDDAQSAEVQGYLLAIDRDNLTLTIHREAIEKWDRPAATMDFSLAEAALLQGLAVGQQLHFRFTIIDGEFVISDITVITEQAHD